MSCTKDHAHCREITASCTRPERITWALKRIGNAIRVMLKRLGRRSARLWNMSKLSTELMERAGMLTQIGNGEVCVACTAAKPPLVGLKGDAKSYYKRVRLGYILEAMGFFRQLTWEEVGIENVTLLRKAKWRGFESTTPGSGCPLTRTR